MSADERGMGGAFGIYVHWPYCARICPYCAFNVYRARGADSAPLIEAITTDLAAHGARLKRPSAQTLHFGGGTPSLLSGEELAQLIDAARRAFDLAPGAEITLEANPEDWRNFAEHAAAGANRFSIGAQSLDDDALAALGRRHDARAVIDAVEAAAKTGRRVSIDLISARAGQGLEAWREELRAALALPVEHVSIYQLTIEEGTAFARAAARGRLDAPDVETAAAFYEATQEICAAAGFDAYEISNHARGAAARSAHNLIYWRGGEWAGVGPGAHGRFNAEGARIATEAQHRPADYIDAVRENGVGWLTETRLSEAEFADELLIMGLRIGEGADLARIEGLRGRTLNADALAWLQEQELVLVDNGRLKLTPRARLIADRVAAELST